MNRIKATADNKVELWLSPQLEASFRDIFEIEMLQGIRTVEPDGTLYFQFETTPEKIEATRKAFLRIMSQSQNIKYN